MFPRRDRHARHEARGLRLEARGRSVACRRRLLSPTHCDFVLQSATGVASYKLSQRATRASRLTPQASSLTPHPSRLKPLRRRGFTLIELLMASAVTTIILGSLGVLAMTVQTGSDYSHKQSLATQHARVTLGRIQRAVQDAAATTDSPGVAVLAEMEGTWRFPDTLVVWKSDANDDDLPQVNELVVYCPNPKAINELLEITDEADVSNAPALSDTGALAAVVAALKADAGNRKTVLTTMLRTAAVDGAGVTRRAAVRFEEELRPSAAQWKDYRDGIITWEDLAWVQGIHGSTSGLRQTWVRYELQLVPGDGDGDETAQDQRVVAFFGSAALYHQLEKP